MQLKWIMKFLLIVAAVWYQIVLLKILSDKLAYLNLIFWLKLCFRLVHHKFIVPQLKTSSAVQLV